MQIQEIIKKYSAKIDYIDLELILAHSLNKTREFILTYPEYSVNSRQNSIISKNIRRRVKGEPIAYIVGHKEFYGLDFMVNENNLIPRPETELLVDTVISNQQSAISKKRNLKTAIIDVGTGSGNIIISIAYSMQHAACIKKTIKYFATDISHEALKIAKKNAKIHNVDKKIMFLNGDLLSPFIENCKLKIENSTLVVVANLPYLSKEIYKSAPINVKKYEPKSALYSSEQGLQHYTKLLKQIKKILVADCWLPASTRKDDCSSTRGGLITVLLEFSPEQKRPLEKLIRNILPQAKIFFAKDLAGKWRICKIVL
ncbi:MAG TPA: peptide chain release factor N(5)-glutamine methyltransferase [Candidatus Moranbacteria bacterium]|nr:peptide chain release factor N(5)-glutamine methyltransferase [Candidatus Moranbacteria bacterium]HRY27920.1 peptide chain release factor N(5)-glutamine methyltransferase [Candidatus Moranbacteria bacterium]HSA08391.1 peptide chain release factor N(5)-glutamine methyltransferase [Candidatus Moranbacteria bacterium]